MKIIFKHHLLFINTILVLLLGISCTSEPDYQTVRMAPSPEEFTINDPFVSIKKILAKYDQHLNEYKEGVYFNNWNYDPTTNNITCLKKENKEAHIEAFNHKLGIGFQEYIAKENSKTLKYQAVSAFANMKETDLYSKPLLLNGEPYSGVLVGTHVPSGKRILEARFYKGVRIGTFNIWTNLDRLYTKSFQKNNKIAIDLNAVRKPVIYLYPTKTQATNVKVHFKGELTHTYPKYPAATGWNVTAEPNGMLTDHASGKQFSYLFWEGNSDFQYTLDKGFVVKGEYSADFLDEQLAIMGLNRKEATDFVSYWLPELEKNPYNLIHFSTTEYQQNAPLEITPAPETLIRVFMVYRPLQSPIKIAAQSIKPIQRQGYTVVEWGGKKATNFIN